MAKIKNVLELTEVVILPKNSEFWSSTANVIRFPKKM